MVEGGGVGGWAWTLLGGAFGGRGRGGGEGGGGTAGALCGRAGGTVAAADTGDAQIVVSARVDEAHDWVGLGGGGVWFVW